MAACILRLAPKQSQPEAISEVPISVTARKTESRSSLFATLPFHMDPQPEQAAPSISLASYLRLVSRNRNFRRLWLAQIVSEIGDWFYTLSIYTLLLQLTGHASSVALALILQVLPQTFIGPTAGVVNDRLRRKHVMIAADLVRVVVVLAMLLVRSASMVWLVYPLLLAETMMAAFFEPARSAVIPNIAAKGEILIANTLSSATWSVNLLIGASVGGDSRCFFWKRRGVCPERAVISDLSGSYWGDALLGAPRRGGGPTASARPDRFFSCTRRHSLRTESSHDTAYGFREGR